MHRVDPFGEAPTSHPVPQKSTRSWGKKEGREGSKWEPGVIGREKARVIIDGSGKR